MVDIALRAGRSFRWTSCLAKHADGLVNFYLKKNWMIVDIKRVIIHD